MIRKIIVIVIFTFSSLSFGQDTENAYEGGEGIGPKRQISTIIYMGLGGAVLGLSTLSFYGRPQDHLTNIAIGFGAGIIVGAVYQTWIAATRPDDFYGGGDGPVYEEGRWPIDDEPDTAALFIKKQDVPIGFSYQWTF